MTEAAAPRASERRVLELLASHGPLTRQALASLAGMPARTVDGAAARLVARGLVQQRREEPEEIERRHGRGRPALVLDLPAGGGAVGAVVVSHHDIRAALITATGALLTPVVREPLQWWKCADLAAEAERLLQDLAQTHHSLPAIGAVVLGVPQPYRQGVGVTLLEDGPSVHRDGTPYPDWLRRDLAQDLLARLGVPGIVENNVNLAALGEAVLGAGARAECTLYLVLGGILAAGIVVNGQLVRGAAGAAGELGHVHHDPNGPVCYCGARGCLGITANAGHVLEALRPRYGQDLSFFDVLSLAAQGDTGVRRVLFDLGSTVGAALATTIVMLDPERIVLDATIGPAAVPLIDGLRAAISLATPKRLGDALSITVGTLEDAAFAGAAVLARTSQRQLGGISSR